METIDKNRLIETFMTGRIPFDDGNLMGELRGSPGYENWHMIVKSDELEYHTSWDWLMPVVEKIEAIPGIYFDIYREATIVKHQPAEFKAWGVTEYNQESKIAHVYEAAVKFIQWYNSNTPNHESTN